MFWQSLKMLLWMILITGIAYPVLITLMAQFTMPFEANGSFLSVKDKVVGSRLIGQKFGSDKYFWGRPSAHDYDALASGGSNLGPISRELKELVAKRKANLLKTNAGDPESIPSDMLFASGSGLDPHITVQAALYQKSRIVKARGGDAAFNAKLDELIEKYSEQVKFHLIGVPCINVLELNLALDELQGKP